VKFQVLHVQSKECCALKLGIRIRFIAFGRRISGSDEVRPIFRLCPNQFDTDQVFSSTFCLSYHAQTLALVNIRILSWVGLLSN
jgi:hypothetical protein